MMVKPKRNEKLSFSEQALLVGLFLADILLLLSLLHVFFGWVEGFINLFLILFQEFGYALNFLGILIGIICAFIFGFVFTYWYLLTKKFLVRE